MILLATLDVALDHARLLNALCCTEMYKGDMKMKIQTAENITDIVGAAVVAFEIVDSNGVTVKSSYGLLPIEILPDFFKGCEETLRGSSATHLVGERMEEVELGRPKGITCRSDFIEFMRDSQFIAEAMAGDKDITMGMGIAERRNKVTGGVQMVAVAIVRDKATGKESRQQTMLISDDYVSDLIELLKSGDLSADDVEVKNVKQAPIVGTVH